MPKVRARYTVFSRGVERLLISITETSDKSLIISPSSAQYHDLIDVPTEVENLYFTVHPSQNSSVYTIHRHLKYKNGRSVDNSSFVRDSKDNFARPLFARLCPIMYSDRFNPKLGGRSKLINIGSFNPETVTLTYFVYVTDSKMEIESISRTLYFGYISTFSIFRVIVVPSMVRIPSLESGTTLSYGFGEDRWDGGGQRTGTVVDPIRFDDIPAHVTQGHLDLRPQILRLVRRYHGVGPELVRAAQAMSLLSDRPVLVRTD